MKFISPNIALDFDARKTLPKLHDLMIKYDWVESRWYTKRAGGFARIFKCWWTQPA